MKKRALSALTVALLGASSIAITPAQRTHLNQVLSEMGAVVVACPATVAGHLDICARFTSSPDLAMKSWDLYASWASKVSMTAVHSTPWKQSAEGFNTAAFRLNDGSTYVVAITKNGSSVDLAILTDDTRENAPAAAPQAQAGTPRAVVNAQAAPTRRGPFVLTAGTARGQGLTGPVKEVTIRAMKVDASGRETLASTERSTFLPDGRELTSSRTDASGRETESAQNIYVAGRLTERRTTEKGLVRVLKYEYDAAGNLTTRSEYNADGQKVKVTRYEAMPNGYVSADYGASGDATRRSFVVQDADGNAVEEENFGKKSTPDSVGKTTFVGGIKTYDMFDIPGNLKIELWYEQGRTTRTKSTAAGNLLATLNSESVFRYEQPDGRGNYLKKIEGTQTLRFGETTFVPKGVEYLSIQYY